MNNSNKEEDKYKWVQSVAVFLVLFYLILAFYDWIKRSSTKEKVEGVIGFIVLIGVSILIYVLSCWSTDMPVDIPGLFGFN